MKFKRNSWIIIATIMVMMLGIGYAGAQEQAAAGEKPEWWFNDVVDAEFVKGNIKIPMDQDVMLIDARPKRSKYDKGHIPMAVSIPDSSFDKMTNLLPENKGALLIYYCEGPKCKLSHKSAAKAVKLGYTNVKVYSGGYPEWVSIQGNYGSVDTAWVKKQIDSQEDMVLVDSRPKRTKYDKGHVPGALSIPDSSFEKMTNLLPQDKDKLLVFYCEGLKCKLSHKSAAKAIAMGYKNVKVYSLGYPEWKKVVGDSGDVIKAGKEEGSIDVEAFKKIITEKPESIMLVDVRDKEDFESGSFKTAVNMQLDVVEAKVNELPTDKPIVFVCNTGAMSGEVYYMLQDVKPSLKNVFYLEAECTYNKDGSVDIKAPM